MRERLVWFPADSNLGKFSISNLQQILDHQTIVERVHLGEVETRHGRLDTGARVAFLVKSEMTR